MQPVNPPIKQVTLPNSTSDVSIQLIQRNAALTAYGIDLFASSGDLIKHVLDFNSHNPLQTPHVLGAANSLKGDSTDCFGVVFSATDVNLKLYCELLIDRSVIAQSNVADITLNAATAHRAFHIQFSFA